MWQWLWDKIAGNFLWDLIRFFLVAFVFAKTKPYLSRAWQWTAARFRRKSRPALVAPVPVFARTNWLDSIGVWFLAVAIFLLGLWNQSIVREQRRLSVEMKRFVLPRTLTEEQKKVIADFLSHVEPHEITMVVVPHDEEAGSYRSDIQQALERAGWPVIGIKNEDVQEGLGISISEPMQIKTSEDLARERVLPHKQSPVTSLREAFESAGIEGVWTAGVSEQGVTKTTVTISIGHRRRDRWAITPKGFFDKQKQPETLTDEDFLK